MLKEEYSRLVRKYDRLRIAAQAVKDEAIFDEEDEYAVGPHYFVSKYEMDALVAALEEK